MKKKSLFKRLSSAAMALLLSLSALTQGITASAFSDTNKASQQWLNEWSYDFRGSGLPNGYDIETGKSNDTHFTGYWASSVPYSQHQTAAMLIVSTLTSSIQAEQHLSRKNLRTM